jgi:hypothetical protein
MSYALDNQCLPDQGVITLGNIEQPFAIRKGVSFNIRYGFKYVENGYGHAVELDAHPAKAADIGVDLVAHALSLGHEVIYAEYAQGYMDEYPSSMRGHYLLVSVSPLVHGTRKAIIFVSETYDRGRVYQHYSSNALKTDTEVLNAFETLKSKGRLAA